MEHNRKMTRGIQCVRAEGEEPDINALVTGLNQAFAQFKTKHQSEVDDLRRAIDEQATQAAARQMNGNHDPNAAKLDGGGVKVLRTAAEFQAHYAGKSEGREEGPSLQDFMRGVAGMKSTDAVLASMSTGTDSAGGYSVPTKTMPGILSALVPASSLMQAGAGIVPMEAGAKSVTTAAIDTIPTASWRAELGNVAESDPSLRAVTAAPKSLACIVRVSRELLADGTDVDRALRLTIAQAFAKELDRVGLMGSGTAPEPRGLRNTSGINIVSMGTNGAALANYGPLLSAHSPIIAANAPAPTADIMAGRTLLDFEGLEDTTGQQLRRPRMIETMQFLPTSQLPVNVTQGTSTDTSEIYVGNFSGLYFLMREAISVQLLREAYAKTGEIGFLCHVRADVVINYPQQFAVITGVKPAV
ncbi:HK97 family phage major capsid protein [Lysobacter ruishenii]|uniref:HK97 family phage major capsid protein n=2 Tax=Aerolutibacter ruishenii TaxID=686800 RepID=A0A562LYI8_9GAMM|nr:HK97 family phage major capsid protein [Lysobacter ruishenii]